MSEWQTYHPKNGGKLFLAYWIEKIKTLKETNRKSLDYYFKFNKAGRIENSWRIYNGSDKYVPKLKANYQYYKDKFD